MKKQMTSTIAVILGITLLFGISACADDSGDASEAEQDFQDELEEDEQEATENNVAYSQEFAVPPQVYEPINACSVGTQAQAGAEFLTAHSNEGEVPGALRSWRSGVVLHMVSPITVHYPPVDIATDNYGTVLYVNESGIEVTLMMHQVFFATLRPGDFFVYYDGDEDYWLSYNTYEQLDGVEVIGHDVFACLPQSA